MFFRIFAMRVDVVFILPGKAQPEKCIPKRLAVRTMNIIFLGTLRTSGVWVKLSKPDENSQSESPVLDALLVPTNLVYPYSLTTSAAVM